MSSASTPDILILGAGMAGLATAYHLAVKHQLKNILILDERTPLGLTSSRGTMAYRNWFPGPGDAMVQLLNRSIDLLRALDLETNHGFGLSQNGYMYISGRPEQTEVWRAVARDAEHRGVGAFREHQNAASYSPSPVGTSHFEVPSDGIDLINDPDTIHQLYPLVNEQATSLLHIRRCGAFDAIALGNLLFDMAKQHGVSFVQDRVSNISTRGNRIESVQLASGARISPQTLVVAAGPLLPDIGRMLDLDLPVYNELHAKITFPDTQRVFPRYADLLLWNDAQSLDWDAQEHADFVSSNDTRWLSGEFPGGVHYLPKGTADDPNIMALWTYDIQPTLYREPPLFDPHYAEIVLRGLAQLIPQAKAYFGYGHSIPVTGGYYCKTRENRPLIGPLPVAGAYIIGALSGYGVMASLGAAELLSAHVVGTALPTYAGNFLLARYQDPEYLGLLNSWDPRSGQL